MLDWIEHVLALFVSMVLPGIIPILFLDQFRVHKMGLIVNAIQALGVQVEFTPAGCTGLIQPVNVGFNKAFKCKMRDGFLKWMMMQDPNLPIPGSMRHNVAQWIINTQNNICTKTICNMWRKRQGSLITPRTPKIKQPECSIDSCNPFFKININLLINRLNNQFH
jgi:hypothetical protein